MVIQIGAAAGVALRGAALLLARKALVAYAKREGTRKIARKIAENIKTLMKNAQKLADDALDAERKRRASCPRCKGLDDLVDPCFVLRGGTGTGLYAGGSYSGVRRSGYEAHHIPASSSYVTKKGYNKMPAIQMEVNDHALTASYKNFQGAEGYRNNQKAYISKGDIMKAFAMDVADIKSKFGSKYDQAIIEASAYLFCILKFPKKYPFIPNNTKKR